MITVCPLHMLKRARYRFLKKIILLNMNQIDIFVDPFEVEDKLDLNNFNIFLDA